MASYIVLAVILMNGNACQRGDAVSVIQSAARLEKFPVDDMVVGEVLGPVTWKDFVSTKPERRGDTGTRTKVGKSSFWYVRLDPRRSEGKANVGGDYAGFVDARTCDVLRIERGR